MSASASTAVSIPHQIASLNDQLSARADQFKAALPAHIRLDQFQRTIITAVQSDPALLDYDRQSFFLACMKAAQDGLLPDKREAAFVMFKENKKDPTTGQWRSRFLVQYMPMVYGLRKKILQSGKVTDITAKVVYRAEVERGAFIYEEGTEAMLRHKPLLDLTEDEASDANIVAAYSMATYDDGSKSYEVMRRFEVDKVRECSQTGATKDRKGQPRNSSGPWVDWFPEQAKKTVMRRHGKTLPMSGDLIDVEAQDEVRYARGLDEVLSSKREELPTPTPAPSRSNAATAIDYDDQSAGVPLEGVDPETGEVLTAEPEKPKANANASAISNPKAKAKAKPSPKVERQADEAAYRAMDGREEGANTEGEGEGEGPSDDQRGEVVTLASAKDEIDKVETVIDVNSRTKALASHLNDDEADALIHYAEARVDTLKGRT